MNNFGFVFIATEHYKRVAEYSEGIIRRKVREASGDVPVNITIEPAVDVIDAFRKRLTLPEWTPYDTTIYLDCDMVLVDPDVIAKAYWSIVYSTAVFMSGWQIADVEWLWPQSWSEQLSDVFIPEDSRQIVPNAGMIGFKKDYAKEFFERWHRVWSDRLGRFDVPLLEPAFVRAGLEYRRFDSWIHVPSWAYCNKDLRVTKAGFVHCTGELVPGLAEDLKSQHKLDQMVKIHE